MSIRKRTWTTSKGERIAWVVDYSVFDPKEGVRIRAHRTFKRREDAKNFAATTHVQIGEGTHVPMSATLTVAAAGDKWIGHCEQVELEPTTIDQYQQHLRLHIKPFIGHLRLPEVTVPTVVEFQKVLHAKARSAAMVRGVTGSLRAIFATAQEHGYVNQNPVSALSHRRRRRGNGDRQKKKLRVGVDIPTPDEIRAIMSAAKGHWRPLLLTAIFTGLRASELRGLRWSDVDLGKRELHVRQRADRRNKIGQPKSAAGQRTVPLLPGLASELRQWKLKCPKKDGKHGLVFPNGQGNPEYHGNIVDRWLKPTIMAAKVTAPVLDAHGNPTRDDNGKPIVTPKYTGLHAFRHFFASWCINRKQDGGLELPPKVVQERMGHASIQMTLDVYGHLFPRADDSGELALAEKAFFGVS
jgi:integrase